MARINERSLTEYRKDERNANKGTPRGRLILRESAQELRAGRSLVADADDVLIGGNHMQDALIEAGITKVVEVETTGDEVVVVKRIDMRTDDSARQRLAVVDNWGNRVNFDPDVDVLLEMPEAWEGWIRQDEIDDLMASEQIAELVNDQLDQTVSTQRKLGNPKHQVKPVLYVDEISIFEQALKATGLRNRGQALLTICKAYLEREADLRV